MPSKRKTKKKTLVMKKYGRGRMLKAHLTGMHEETGEIVDLDDMLDAHGHRGTPPPPSALKDPASKRQWRRGKTALDIAESMEFDPTFVHSE